MSTGRDRICGNCGATLLPPHEETAGACPDCAGLFCGPCCSTADDGAPHPLPLPDDDAGDADGMATNRYGVDDEVNS